MRIAALMAIAAIVLMPNLPTAAEAASVGEVFQELDLFGTWALDCSKPATPANPHLRILAGADGEAEEIHDLGPGFSINRYRVLTAQGEGDRLEVTVMFRAGETAEQGQRLVFEIGRGTRRTLFNQPEGGAVRVKDGVIVANGRKTPVLRKCG